LNNDNYSEEEWIALYFFGGLDGKEASYIAERVVKKII
jgi:hypothetical protein